MHAIKAHSQLVQPGLLELPPLEAAARAIIRLLERTDPEEASELSEALYRTDGDEG